MKVSAIAIALISPVTAEFSLRSWMQSPVVETYDTRIVVSGLTAPVSDEDANHVAKHAMAAYNYVFGATSTGQKLQDIEITAATNIPAESFWWTGECRFCAMEGKSSDKEAAFINARVGFSILEDSTFLGFFNQEHVSSSDLHFQFEEDLCTRLRTSGMPNFANAKDCSFSFLAKPGMTDQVPLETTYSHNTLAQAELILAGSKSGLSRSDAKFLNEVVVEAHNEAFAKFGLLLGSFQVLADISVGGYHGWLQQCTPCCYDDQPLCGDDAFQTRNTVTVIVGDALPLHVVGGAELKHYDAEISNAALDTLICTKLRNSGKPTFEDVHTCSFNFVYSEVSSYSVPEVN